MEQFQFVMDYKNDTKLRNSFFDLAKSVFGISFESWYENGFWTKRYIPFSYVDDGKVIANVSINILDLMVNGKEKSALQMGTVMTHPDYRQRGLSTSLMNKVLEKYEKNYDYIYLLANHSVIDFYPKFGFKAVQEYQYSMSHSISDVNNSGIRKLDGTNKENLNFIYEFASNRIPNSQVFASGNALEILMFYCLNVFYKDIYYLIDEEVIIIYSKETEQLHIYDIISKREINIERILSKISDEQTKNIFFHFTPDFEGVKLSSHPYHGTEVLFMKSKNNIIIPNNIKHPITSQA